MKRVLLCLAAGLFLLCGCGVSSPGLRQHRLHLPSWQYSGITHVSEDTYAVVHDKRGGLFFFTITLSSDGKLQTAQAFEAYPVSRDILDNEDIVYVPETQTLFVSAEADQSIREYGLSGKATGRRLSIPEDLAHSRKNQGFESLAYANGKFWTTTETPLPSEDRPHVHCLQAFSLETLSPSARLYYQTDEPSVSPANASRATAYVHGISAMTALPDGRLLILEREVYVPGEGLGKKVKGTFCECKLFSVNPADDSPILRKTLLRQFRTKALNLANYEGMCLGPVLSDGRQTLLLLADSQDGAGGLTHEYLQIITGIIDIFGW